MTVVICFSRPDLLLIHNRNAGAADECVDKQRTRFYIAVMSNALFCPHCRGAVIPVLKPAKLRKAYDSMADTRRQQTEAKGPCPICGQEIRVEAVYNERGQFEHFVSIAGYRTTHSSCPVCHHIGLKRIDHGPLYLPPTGGDYEWVELTTDQCFCPICDHAFEAKVKILLENKEIEIMDFFSNSDSWGDQYVLTKVYYARGEVYCQEAVRTFRTREELDAFWALFQKELMPMAECPENFDWQRLLYRNREYIWE